MVLHRSAGNRSGNSVTACCMSRSCTNDGSLELAMVLFDLLMGRNRLLRDGHDGRHREGNARRKYGGKEVCSDHRSLVEMW